MNKTRERNKGDLRSFKMFNRFKSFVLEIKGAQNTFDILVAGFNLLENYSAFKYAQHANQVSMRLKDINLLLREDYPAFE